jgi:CheY-like chemotaxis protein
MIGPEVLKEIKSDDELKRIPVVILTTSTAEEDINECYNNHANCYITKPLDFDEFANTMNSIKSFWFNMVELPKI